MSHTPGPWRWAKNPNVPSNFEIHAGDLNRPILIAVDPLHYQYLRHTDQEQWLKERDKEVEADARLIAAAPDLLEAAKLALRIAESWIHSELDGTSSLESDLGELWPIRAAIAKAEGS